MNFPHPAALSGLHLFYHPLSNCAGRVLLAVLEKGLPVEKHRVNLLKSEQLSEPYLAFNPKGEAPTIVHNGQPLAESITILRYLETHFPQAPLMPEQLEQKQLAEQWLDQAAASHPAVINYVYAQGYGRLPTPQDQAFYERHIPHRARFHQQRRQGLAGCDISAVKRELDNQHQQLEDTLAKHPWLAGDQYSLADIAWFPNVLVLSLLGYSFNAFPHIQRWRKQIEQRPALKQGYRKELPAIPFWLLGIVARTATRLIRKTGNRR